MNTVSEFIKKEGLRMDNTALEVLINHLNVLKKRIEDHEQLDDISEKLMGDVSEQTFEIVDRLLEVVSIRREDLTVSERFLVGTHIQVALNLGKEG